MNDTEFLVEQFSCAAGDLAIHGVDRDDLMSRYKAAKEKLLVALAQPAAQQGLSPAQSKLLELWADGKIAEWRPIETAPKDGTEIILRKADRVSAGNWIDPVRISTEPHATTGEPVQLVEHEEGFWQSWDGGFADDDEPTHWMPLPEPPK